MNYRHTGILCQVAGILAAIAGIAIFITSYIHRGSDWELRPQTEEAYWGVYQVEWGFIIAFGLAVGYLLFRTGSHLKSKSNVGTTTPSSRH